MKKLKYTISYNHKENTWKVWRNLIIKKEDIDIILGFKPIFQGSYKACEKYLKENNLSRNKLYKLPS